MKIPQPEITISSLIDKHHADLQSGPRAHLGASMLGHPCDRWLWLSFRWAVQQKFNGRMLRLFRRGHLEEAQIISDLRAIGMNVKAPSGKQAQVDFGSHVSGSLDAIIESGVPTAVKTKHVAEFKTHSAKSFNALEKDGVEKAKPEHFVQMQVYMHGTGIDRALYVAVCKDDDRIHTERVIYDKEVALRAISRGKRIALSDRMPEPLSADPTWFECKWCPAHDFCFESKLTQHANCRTCSNSTAKEDSTWHCAKWDDNIPPDAQREGCDHHVLHPDLVPWQRVDGPNEWTATYVIDGKEINNGEANFDVWGSKELIANPKAIAIGDPLFAEFRDEWNARVVG